MFDHPQFKKKNKRFKWNFLYFNLYLLLLVLLVDNTEKSLAPSFVHPPISHEYALIRPPKPSLLELKQAQFSQLPLVCQMLQCLGILVALGWAYSSMSCVFLLYCGT